MDKPKISVIIPTCHRNDLLAKCLDCLAPDVQTLPAEQYEVIVTDDGSRSTAENMVRKQYPWASWVSGPKKGPAANRNNGAKNALGTWMAFTDDDCLPEPGWLLAFVAATLVGEKVYEGKTICKSGLRSPLYQAPINVKGGFLWSCNIFIAKEVFQELEGFDECFPHPHLEDVDLRCRLTARNYRFVFVPDAVVDHPPRLAGWGKRKAEIEESHFYLFYKHGNTGPLKWKLLYSTLRFRYNALKTKPLGIDSFRASGLVVIETLFYLAKSGKWEAKYSRQFNGVEKAAAHK